MSSKLNFTNIAGINQSEKAKKKIAGIAKNNNREYELAYSLLSFYWNYDELGREAAGWVDIKNIKIDDEYNKRYEVIYKTLDLTDEKFDKTHVVEKRLMRRQGRHNLSQFLLRCLTDARVEVPDAEGEREIAELLRNSNENEAGKARLSSLLERLGEKT
jgi:hypothetical protein